MVESVDRHWNSITEQHILVVFELVRLVLRCTLTMSGFQGSMIEPEVTCCYLVLLMLPIDVGGLGAGVLTHPVTATKIMQHTCAPNWHDGGARRRRRRRPPTASRLKGPRKQKSFAYKLLKRGLANLMSPTSTSGVAPPLHLTLVACQF
ncbi:hypothetical protein EVAR_9443_1 [Eumeta japonica]|uniref:Uncharacterized protein n=1 Tax=Eumeta variegata TaxID=151549 RepID=A0A4C1UD23_EUMVA|nr:hypothetical protein EVAR_9443_1 [Eumeta japonica]